MPFRVGDVLAGKYRVERLLGTGGMGFVVAALHLELDERVALKFLRTDMLKDEGVVARFARESRSAAKIKSEHIARVMDVGALSDGTPFIVMEHLEGHDLAEELRLRGPIPLKQAAEHVIHACDALGVAHAAGIVHRDVKPENLFLARQTEGLDIVKVLDFGISKAALTGSSFAHDIPLVKTTSLVGSPSYMSPEQVRGSIDVDHRTDIWSLGVVLFELLTGKRPYDAPSINEICAAILEKPVPSVRAIDRELPEAVEAIIQCCLQKDVSKRFESVADLAIALLPHAPKRARISAERCTAVMRSAGFTKSDPSLFPSMLPEPPSRRRVPLPVVSDERAHAMTVPAFQSSPSVSPSPEPTAKVEQPRKRRALLAAAVAMFVAAGALVVVGVQTRGVAAPVKQTRAESKAAGASIRAPAPAPTPTPSASASAAAPPATTAAPRPTLPRPPPTPKKTTPDEPDLGY